MNHRHLTEDQLISLGAAAALPAGAFSSYAALFAAWGSILGTVGLALAAIALARGHGPWVESIEEPQP